MHRQVFELYRRAYAGLPREAWILSAVNLVNSAGMMVIFFLALYLTQRLGFTPAEAGRALSIYGFGSLAGAWLGGWLSDRIGSTAVQKLSLVVGGLFLIVMGQTGTPWLLFTALFVFSTAAGSLYPANAASMSRICPPDLHTKGFALNRLANNLGVTIGPAIGGLLALRDYRLLFWADGLTCIAAAAVFVLLWRHPERTLRAMERAERDAGAGPAAGKPLEPSRGFARGIELTPDGQTGERRVPGNPTIRPSDPADFGAARDTERSEVIADTGVSPIPLSDGTIVKENNGPAETPAAVPGDSFIAVEPDESPAHRKNGSDRPMNDSARVGSAARKPDSPWRDIPFLLLMPIILVWSTVFVQLFSTFPLYMRNVYGLAEDAIGRLVAVNTILIVLFEMALMEKVRRVSRTALINVSFILLGLGFGLMPLGRGFAFGAFTVAVWTFGEILSMPLMSALVAGRSGPAARGRYMGLFSFTFSLGFIVAPALGTAVYDRFGSDALWFGCAAAGVLMAAMFSLLRPALDKPAGV